MNVGTVIAVISVSIAALALFLPSLKRSGKERAAKREGDIAWTGRKGANGLPDILPMWKRVETLEENDRKRTVQLDAVDKRTKQLVPGDDGEETLFDLLKHFVDGGGHK